MDVTAATIWTKNFQLFMKLSVDIPNFKQYSLGMGKIPNFYIYRRVFVSGSIQLYRIQDIRIRITSG